MAKADYLSQCQRSIAIRGLGTPGFTFPPEAGLPIGGPMANPYYRIEVHYANLDNKTGWILILVFPINEIN